MYTFQEGTVADALAVEAQIPEFEHKSRLQRYTDKLSNKKHLILVAKNGDQCIGYKVGYELSSDEFYSWMGGVAPKHRGQGIAKRLKEMQESWVVGNDYKVIRVKSTNHFPNMLHMLIASGYQIDGYDDTGDLRRNKIHFSKRLVD